MITYPSAKVRRSALREQAVALFSQAYPALFAWWHPVDSGQATMQALADRAGITADRVCAYVNAGDRVIIGIESATPPLVL